MKPRQRAHRARFPISLYTANVVGNLSLDAFIPNYYMSPLITIKTDAWNVHSVEKLYTDTCSKYTQGYNTNLVAIHTAFVHVNFGGLTLVARGEACQG